MKRKRKGKTYGNTSCRVLQTSAKALRFDEKEESVLNQERIRIWRIMKSEEAGRE